MTFLVSAYMHHYVFGIDVTVELAGGEVNRN